MKSLNAFYKSSLFAAALFMAGGASAADLRYAHVGYEGDIQTQYAAEAAEAIAKATDGRVKINIYPAGQLGNDAEMVDGIKMGSISLGHHDFASLARLAPEMAIFNAPFIYRDGAHALKATDPATSEALREVNAKLIKEDGVRVIGRIYRGARHISSNFPVKSPEDLKGKPFRAVPLELWVSMVKGFGAVPTPVAVTELPTALMTGLVVGQENPLTMMYANKLYEVQSHVSMTGHMHAILAVFINEDVWQSFSDEDRQAISKVLDEKAHDSLRWATESEEDLIAKLKEQKMTFITKEDGLDLDAFQESVLKQINADFPTWGPYIERIKAVQ